jgi:hypothetical protein
MLGMWQADPDVFPVFTVENHA